MPEYTAAAVGALLIVVALELGVLKTGVFRRPTYWASMAIVLGFQVIVDGWLTKLSASVVLYSAEESSGVRFPWDIPVEDFAYGTALVTLVLMLWERLGEPAEERSERPSMPSRAGTRPPGS